MNLKNKVIVITGASKGLGKALAAAFGHEKSKVVMAARSQPELKLASKETDAAFCVADVTKERDMQKLARFAVKKFGRVDIWVNNAGVTIPHSEIEDIDAQKAQHVMSVNFWGLFYGSRAALKLMKKQKRGLILNIVSMSSLVGRPRSAVYAASKWAARGFTESLRLALEPYHIPVITVHPGGIKTGIFGKFKPAGYDTWMEPAYVARKVVENLKRQKPKLEIIVHKR